MKQAEKKKRQRQQRDDDPWKHVIWFHDIPVLREAEQQQFDPSEW